MSDSEGVPGRDEQAVRRFVERFGLDLAAAGVPRMAARVFSAVLADERGRMDAAELGELLGVSPAAISGAVRYLTQVRLLTREREPGARRDHFRIDDDTWSQNIVDRDALLKQWDGVLREGIEAVGPDSHAGRRLAKNLEFFAFLRRELPRLLDKWHAQQSADES